MIAVCLYSIGWGSCHVTLTAGPFRPNWCLATLSENFLYPAFRLVTEQNTNDTVRQYYIAQAMNTFEALLHKKRTPAQCSGWLNYGFMFTNDLPNWLTLFTKRKNGKYESWPFNRGHFTSAGAKVKLWVAQMSHTSYGEFIRWRIWQDRLKREN